ncbi:hypothetical protein [Salinactinospora qingdaonensis]|uniref:Tellurite resistance protein TerB n=1 Tax=Salinactinospora qingdaonensis TaxID=702744 RepID=A0ABP7F8I8_9ACTN
MDSDLDARLHDHVALAEIELYTELLVAVAATDGQLTVEEIDEVLGVLPQRPLDADPPVAARTGGTHRRRRRGARRSRR